MTAMLLTATTTPRPCHRSRPAHRAPREDTLRTMRLAVVANSRRPSHPPEAMVTPMGRTTSVTTPPCQRSRLTHKAPGEVKVATLALDDILTTRQCQPTGASTILQTAPIRASWCHTTTRCHRSAPTPRPQPAPLDQKRRTRSNSNSHQS